MTDQRPTVKDDAPVFPRIEGYRIVRELGRGGMGVVYLAEQTMLGRKVAVKALPLGKNTDRESLDRFLGEARALASLGRHEHLVQVYDVVRDREGNYYIVMEFVEGRTLDVVLEKGPPLGTRDAVGIVADAARALHHAHERGIIHRDIKPGNLMLASGTDVRVMDFGLARQDTRPTLTATGMVFGTPTYMSPEQLRGERDLDRRSDVYSLCVVLYHLICGEPPFDGDNAYAIGIKHLHEPPRPPRTFWPMLSPRLDALILKGMNKERDDRFESCAELAQALEDFLRDESKTPPRAPAFVPPSTVDDDEPVALASTEHIVKSRMVEREPATRRLPPWLLAAIAVLLVVGTLAGWRLSRRPIDERPPAAEPVVEATPAATPTPAPTPEPTPAPTPVPTPTPPPTVVVEQPLSAFQTRGVMQFALALDPSGRRAYSGTFDSALCVWDMTTGRLEAEWRGHGSHIATLDVSGDGERILTGSSDNTARVWDRASGDEVLVVRSGRSSVTAVRWLPSGGFVVGAADGTLAAYDDRGNPRATTRAHARHLRAIEIAPDGRLATIGGEPGVRLWVAGTLAPAGVLGADLSPPTAVAFSLDGATLFTADREGTLRAWDAGAGSEAARWRSPVGDVLALAVSPEGNRVASGHRDGTVIVWDTSAQRALFVLRGPPIPVNGVSFTAGGNELLSAHGGRRGERDTGALLLWRLSGD